MMAQCTTDFALDTLLRKKIEKLRRKEKDARIHQRLSALLWLDQDYSAQQVADLLGVCPRTVQNWAALFRAGRRRCAACAGRAGSRATARAARPGSPRSSGARRGRRGGRPAGPGGRPTRRDAWEVVSPGRANVSLRVYCRSSGFSSQ